MVINMVLSKIYVVIQIDEQEECKYTVEGTTCKPPYDNIEIMLRRTEINNKPQLDEVEIREFKNLFSAKDYETIQKIHTASKLSWSQFLFKAAQAYKREQAYA
jgi:hypothetical protein